MKIVHYATSAQNRSFPHESSLPRKRSDGQKRRVRVTYCARVAYTIVLLRITILHILPRLRLGGNLREL